MKGLGEETSYEFPKNMDLEFQESWRTSVNIGIWGQDSKCAAIKIKPRYQHLIMQHRLYSNNPVGKFLPYGVPRKQ